MTTKTRVRGRSLFKQADMERAMRGAKASGFEIGGVEVTADGTIRLLRKDIAASEVEWAAATAKLQAT
jgi:hypothetical protein